MNRSSTFFKYEEVAFALHVVYKSKMKLNSETIRNSDYIYLNQANASAIFNKIFN